MRSDLAHLFDNYAYKRKGLRARRYALSLDPRIDWEEQDEPAPPKRSWRDRSESDFPVDKMLRSHVGQQWNDVHSEFVSLVRGNSRGDYRSRDCLNWVVEREVFMRDGVVCDLRGKPLTGRWRRDGELYVHPESGVLSLAPYAPYRYRYQKDKIPLRIPIDKNKAFVQRWYLVPALCRCVFYRAPKPADQTFPNTPYGVGWHENVEVKPLYGRYGDKDPRDQDLKCVHGGRPKWEKRWVIETTYQSLSGYPDVRSRGLNGAEYKQLAAKVGGTWIGGRLVVPD